jgi:hypothetical protein
MNVKSTIALILAAAVTVPAFAGDIATIVDTTPLRTKVTRAEVKAEVLRARAAGELDITEATFPFQYPAAASTLTRAEVKAEVLRARTAGELDFTEASANYPSI